MLVNAYTIYEYFKLIHSRIVTNKKLVEMNVGTDSSCVYCNAELETLSHAFIECSHVKKLWKNVEDWLKTSMDPYLKIGDPEKIFRF